MNRRSHRERLPRTAKNPIGTECCIDSNRNEKKILYFRRDKIGNGSALNQMGYLRLIQVLLKWKIAIMYIL
jgi:hypothetical protein